MRIAHLLGWYFPDSVGGTEVYVEGLCRRLRAAGHQLFIAAPQTTLRAPNEYVHDGVDVFRFPIPATLTRDEARDVSSVRGSNAFPLWLDRVRPDVLHMHSLTTGVGNQRDSGRACAWHPRDRHLSSAGLRIHVSHRRADAIGASTPATGIVQPSKCASCYLTRIGHAAGGGSAPRHGAGSNSGRRSD